MVVCIPDLYGEQDQKKLEKGRHLSVIKDIHYGVRQYVKLNFRSPYGNFRPNQKIILPEKSILRKSKEGIL